MVSSVDAIIFRSDMIHKQIPHSISTYCCLRAVVHRFWHVSLYPVGFMYLSREVERWIKSRIDRYRRSAPPEIRDRIEWIDTHRTVLERDVPG